MDFKLNRGEVRGGSVAELSGSGTRNPAVPGLCPPLATCWICFGLSQVQIPGFAHTLKALQF